MDPGPGLQDKSHWRRQPGRRRGSHINTGQIRNETKFGSEDLVVTADWI